MAHLTESDVESAAFVWLVTLGWHNARGSHFGTDLLLAKFISGDLQVHDIERLGATT